MFLVYLGIDELEEIFPFVHNFFSFFLIPDFCNVSGHLVVYLGINELHTYFVFFIICFSDLRFLLQCHKDKWITSIFPSLIKMYFLFFPISDFCNVTGQYLGIKDPRRPASSIPLWFDPVPNIDTKLSLSWHQHIYRHG